MDVTNLADSCINSTGHCMKMNCSDPLLIGKDSQSLCISYNQIAVSCCDYSEHCLNSVTGFCQKVNSSDEYCIKSNNDCAKMDCSFPGRVGKGIDFKCVSAG